MVHRVQFQHSVRSETSLFAHESVGREFASLRDVRLEKESFGPILRSARERHGITLKQLARETKLSAELWEGLEENDLSRWPKRVFARSYVRDYALRVGLDADEVVNEFCRLFPEWGDRRAEGVIREKAHIIAHDLTWEDLPAPGERRASDRAAQAAPGFFGRHRERIIAVAIDLHMTFGLGWLGVPLGLWLLAVRRARGRVVHRTGDVVSRTIVRSRGVPVAHPDAQVGARGAPSGLLTRRKRVIRHFCGIPHVSDILSLFARFQREALKERVRCR